MRDLLRVILYGALTLIGVGGIVVVPATGQTWQASSTTTVSDGWHPWYELREDPENSNSFIICGTKWDAKLNTMFGFVYFSFDGGETWQSVLEDRRSPWVSEQSCAFGPKHTAYFVSEASKIVDGEEHHDLGTTQLFTSTDSGRHWEEGRETGWADFSTSAVSRATGRLYTFFHDASTLDPGRRLGSNVGLLVFSADGRTVSGPFSAATIQDPNYRGAYPSDAIALKSGAVVALYQTMDVSQTKGYLALIHADASPAPTLETRVISETTIGKDCEAVDRGSLAYASKQDRLFVVYGDGCEEGPIMLASSDDEGRTWTKGIAITNKFQRQIVSPSLVVCENGTLVLLWEEGWFSGKWLLSTIRDRKLAEPATELAHGISKLEIGSDSVWLQVAQPSTNQSGYSRFRSSITLNVVGSLNDVWRGSGLVARENKILAIWSSGDRAGMRLYSGEFNSERVGSKPGSAVDPLSETLADVTDQTVILYGGIQHFDNTTGAVEVCLTLENRGDKPLRTPIKLEARDIGSSVGTVSITNATNGLRGIGAVWDVSGSITGSQIPPRARSNPFCLSFHVDISPKNATSPALPKLVTLRMTVSAPQ